LIPYKLIYHPHRNSVGGWAHSRPSRSRFYWRPDIQDMAAKLGALQKNIHMCKPGAKNVLKEFKQARMELVKSIPDVCLSALLFPLVRLLTFVSGVANSDMQILDVWRPCIGAYLRKVDINGNIMYLFGS
jgi:hypothetical protein